MYINKLPKWFLYDFRSVLCLGETYPQIRAVCAQYDFEKKIIFVRFYLDRPPTDFDYESTNEILSILAGYHNTDSKLDKITDECVYSTNLIKDLDPLDGFIYSRREYEMQDNPSNEPTYFA